MVYKFFDKTTAGGTAKNEILLNIQLAEELHKPVIRQFEKRKVDSYFIDNIWGAHLADMQLLSKFNKEIRLLIFIVNILWLFLWKIEKVLQ